MNSRVLGFTTAILLLFGCSVTALTPEGRMVREIDKDWASKCTFLGAIEIRNVDGWNESETTAAAFNELRNTVANIGGDSFTVVSQTYSGEMRIQADTYDCSST